MPTLHLRLSQETQQSATSSTHNVELRREIPAQALRLTRADVSLYVDPQQPLANAVSALPGLSIDLGEKMFQGVEVETNVRGLGDCIEIPIEAHKVWSPSGRAGVLTVSVPIDYTFTANELRKSFPITVRSWDNTQPRLMFAYTAAGGAAGPPPTESLIYVDLHFDFSMLTDPNIY